MWIHINLYKLIFSCVILIRSMLSREEIFMSGQNGEKRLQKYVCVGLLAHVDAGKQPCQKRFYIQQELQESWGAWTTGTRTWTHMPWAGAGHHHFSKQAVCQLGDTTVTLLDTPGHVDFSAEMERTLQVLDYAVLVISGADGVQGHTETLWSLLKRYQVPTFLFINKMDQPGTDREALLSELQKRLSESCVDFALLDDADAGGAGGGLGRPSPCRMRSFWSGIWKVEALRRKISAG